MTNLVEQRTQNGCYHRWDLEKYAEYRAKKGSFPIEEINHPFLGKKFLREDGYIVFTKIVKHWYGGYYYWGVYEINDSSSHGACCIENINCINPLILEFIQDFQTEYQEA